MERGPAANPKILRNLSSEKSMRRILMRNNPQDFIKIVFQTRSKKNQFSKETFSKRSFNLFQ
jgi:hypothetical protein